MPSTLNTSPTATAEYTGAQGLYELKTFRVQGTVVHGSAYLNLGYLPSFVQSVAWATMAPGTAGIAVSGGLTTDATNAANCFALTIYPTTNTQALTAPASTASSSAATNLLLISTGTTSGATAWGPPVRRSTNAEPGQNTNTVPALLLLQPANTNSARLQASGTSAFVFGTDSATSTVTYSVNTWVYYWALPSTNPSFAGLGVD